MTNSSDCNRLLCVSALLRTVSTLPVLIVTAIISLEYFVFMTEHWLIELRRSVGHLVLLRVVEGLVFHFVVGCTLVAYYKVVLTGSSDS